MILLNESGSPAARGTRGTGGIENRWKMGQALAIEGVAISGDNIIISDDSYFHQTRRPTNSIQRYAMGH